MLKSNIASMFLSACAFLYKVKNFLYLILLCASTLGYAQGIVSGMVIDESGEAIGFCHVYNQTMGLGKVSDMKGNFKVTASKDDTLHFSYVGYQSLSLPVSSVHLVNFLKVTLPEDSIMLPSITIFADPNYRVPINIKGEPIIIPGVSITERKEPIRAGDVRLGATTGVGNVPIPAATIYGPITYFSKDEKEKRHAEEAYKETRETITYQRFIAQDTVKQKLCEIYQINSAQYDQVIVRLHNQFPGIQKQYNPAEIWNWLLMHFDRSMHVIRDY